MIRVLLVDDHTVVREALARVLDEFPGLAVVGQSADGESAAGATRHLHPDVVLMDVSLPGIDGFAATKLVKAAAPDTRVIILTMHDPAAIAPAVRASGADGFVRKDADMEELVQVIQQGHPATNSAEWIG